MKIENIKINSYGILKEREINLEDNLNIIYGKNESGKSTLLNYMKNIFYGISKNKNGKEISDYEKYKPWVGEEFSGKIKYRLDNGMNYEIYRDFTKKNAKLFDDNLEEISNQYKIDKKDGSQFFYNQTNVDEKMYLSTIMTPQQEVVLERSTQNILVQKIANLAGTGEDNVSFQKAMDKLNKRLVEEVGTSRTQDRPLNVIQRRMKEIETVLKTELCYTENKQNLVSNKNEILEELEKEQNRNSELKKLNMLTQKNQIEEEKNELKKQLQNEKEKKVKKNYFTFGIILVLLIIINILNFQFIDNKIINYILLSLIPIELILFTINFIKNKKLKIELQNQKSEIQKQKEISDKNLMSKIEEIQKQIEASEQQMIDYRLQLNSLEYEDKNISERLEEIISLKEEYENLKEQLQIVEEKNRCIQATKELLEKAYEQMKKSVTPKFTQNLSNLIQKITDGKYQKVSIHEEKGLIVELENGEYKSANLLSVGTIDQLYLSLRLAMLDEISQEKMPIILDEAFAYFDDERLKNSLLFLMEQAKEHQIILFTCTKRERQILEELDLDYHWVEI
ncbi:MAG: AAA family ATPase [Clostridia bacterium]|nr:AAA family ATPase [Clostridia bacterium]